MCCYCLQCQAIKGLKLWWGPAALWSNQWQGPAPLQHEGTANSCDKQAARLQFVYLASLSQAMHTETSRFALHVAQDWVHAHLHTAGAKPLTLCSQYGGLFYILSSSNACCCRLCCLHYVGCHSSVLPVHSPSAVCMHAFLFSSF